MRLRLKIKHAVLNRDGNKCTQCGSRDTLVPHHILTPARGGTDTLDNLVTLCDKCHCKIHPWIINIRKTLKRIVSVDSIGVRYIRV